MSGLDWRIAELGDTHFPFASKRAVDLAIRYVEETKPSIIVQLGDLYDFLSWGRFPRSQNTMTPREEIQKGRSQAIRFWERVHKAAPRAKLLQLLGNHDLRPIKKAKMQAPEFEDCVTDWLAGLFDFPQVEVIDLDQDELVVKGIVHQHGFRALGQHVVHNRHDTVCGHLHRGYVLPHRVGPTTFFELNAGYLGDPYSAALAYAPSRRFSQWTLGVGEWDRRGPRFIGFPNPRHNP